MSSEARAALLYISKLEVLSSESSEGSGKLYRWCKWDARDVDNVKDDSSVFIELDEVPVMVVHGWVLSDEVLQGIVVLV